MLIWMLFLCITFFSPGSWCILGYVYTYDTAREHLLEKKKNKIIIHKYFAQHLIISLAVEGIPFALFLNDFSQKCREILLETREREMDKGRRKNSLLKLFILNAFIFKLSRDKKLFSLILPLTHVFHLDDLV